jgi:hypothetical protein
MAVFGMMCHTGSARAILEHDALEHCVLKYTLELTLPLGETTGPAEPHFSRNPCDNIIELLSRRKDK